MAWASDFPAELLSRPMGLVGLTGLDVTYNAVHKAIWDSFCNNRRPDRVPLKFAVFEGDHEYPKCRSKRTSYEWYVPKGILKTSWMSKHMGLVPAVVVIFFDLDWDEHMWKERQMQCATMVEIIRNSLTGRSTRVAVVLIQKNAPLPPGEDVIAAERAASMCSACELSAKSLFVLPHTDHLLGYTIRLENAFYELAQSYYHTEARRVKAHKEFLNKTTHQLLFVRHQFKIAFYNEQKQDNHTALKHYKQAYSHLLELRMHDTNLLEVKNIAGFINYKICRLSFQHNAPLDAISQFRKHVDFFKNKAGIADISFEHSAWLSKQFQVFGELFDEAIKLGLTAIQTQHPGFYYQQAASHAATRRKHTLQLCKPNTTYPTPDPLESMKSLDYYGQRPWRQGHQSIDPPDSLKERDGISALQCLELKVDHSWLIIPLLRSAVAQFKKYKSPRMKRYLMVLMGEEYHQAKEHTTALQLLTKVTWEYSTERWWPLLTSVLITALRCAYLTASPQDYVNICLELIGKYTLLTVEEKTRIQMNLIRVMSNDPPEPEPLCDAVCIENAKQLWSNLTANQDAEIFRVEMHNIVAFVECKACFHSNKFTADEPIELKVFLRTSCPFPMRFCKLSVLLSNQVYNEACQVSDGQLLSSSPDKENRPETGDLYLVPDHTKVHTFTFLPQPEDVGKLLEITSIALELGSELGRCAILHWTGGGGECVASPSSQLKRFTAIDPSKVTEKTPWDVVNVVPVTRIESRPAEMEITLEHDPPSLVNEFYRVKVHIKSAEASRISDVTLSAGLKYAAEQFVENTTHLSIDEAAFDGKPVSHKDGIQLGTVDPQQQIDKVLFVKCLTTGDRDIYVRVSYKIDVSVRDTPMTCTCYCEESVVVPTLDPFTVSIRLASMQFDKLDAVHMKEPFLLLSDIACSSPWQLDIMDSQVKMSPHFSLPDGEFSSQLKSVSLQSGDCASECCCVEAAQTRHIPVPMGQYSISWRRTSADESIPTVSTTVDLPQAAVEEVPLYLEVDMPAYATVRQKMLVTYSVHNRTSFMQEVEVSMEGSDSFMFSGQKQVHFRVLPNASYSLSYNYFPLLPGEVLLPRLHVNMLRYPGIMDPLVQKMLPSHVYVMPRGKTVEEMAAVEAEA